MIKRAISFYNCSPRKNIKILVYCFTLSLLVSFKKTKNSIVKKLFAFGRFQSAFIFSLIYCLAAIPTLILYLLLEYWKGGESNLSFQPEPVSSLVSNQEKMF